MMSVRRVAVLGAGTIGAQIAAHFANAGVPSLLLDLTREAAQQGLQRARALKPDPFYTAETWQLIEVASFEEGLGNLRDADWIIEAVVEDLEIKRGLLARVDAARRTGSIVSSNTSGIPIAALADGRSEDFRRHWLGTHFFNPPRYLRLLELIPTAETDHAVVSFVRQFADHRLGKGVVIAKDSPGFIGNHIGIFGMMQMLSRVVAGEYSIAEVDAITGPAIGRPKSATFRTIDLAGLDIIAAVVRDLHRRLPDSRGREAFVLPPLVERMLEKGLTGEKAGAGFYRRVKGQAGDSEILALDTVTLEHVPQARPAIESLEATRGIRDTGERVRAIFNSTDRAGQFLRDTLEPTIRYAADVAPVVAHSPDDVDRVMRWGFGWELGPFALGEALAIDGIPRVAAPARPPVIQSNAAASLVDLGDGVLAVEFHSKMNAIDAGTIDMLQAGIREAEAHFAALIIGGGAEHFSVGANLALVLGAVQQGHWADVETMIRTFQQTNGALRYAAVPVIVAPAGMTLGGGCEILLHADRAQAAAESYIGLVETGVGLIPAAGGTKEMVARAAETIPRGDTNVLPAFQRAFETIALAAVSTSGADARRLGYLAPIDGITMNRERLMADAKATALQLVAQGYQPPPRRTAIRVGGDAVLAPLKLGIHLAWSAGRISEHDALIGRTLATIMAGGSLPHPSTVTEEQLLDLECEAFMKLVGEPKTQDRIAYTLKTGKPLRN